MNKHAVTLDRGIDFVTKTRMKGRSYPSCAQHAIIKNTSSTSDCVAEFYLFSLYHLSKPELAKISSPVGVGVRSQPNANLALSACRSPSVGQAWDTLSAAQTIVRNMKR